MINIHFICLDKQKSKKTRNILFRLVGVTVRFKKKFVNDFCLNMRIPTTHKRKNRVTTLQALQNSVTVAALLPMP